MILYPKALLKNVREITIEFIKNNKLKALILDLDNTLIDYDRNLPQETINWAKQLQGQGVKLYILSNTNKIEKVKKVAEQLGKIQYKTFARKPYKKGFIQIQKELGMNPS